MMTCTSSSPVADFGGARSSSSSEVFGGVAAAVVQPAEADATGGSCAASALVAGSTTGNNNTSSEAVAAGKSQKSRIPGEDGSSTISNNSNIVCLASFPHSLEPKVVVLTRGYWPTYDALDLALPLDLRFVVETFGSFYSARFKGRRLSWLHTLSTCVMKAVFPRGKKEFHLSLVQALILNLFNISLPTEASAASSTNSGGATAGAGPQLTVADIGRELNFPLDNAALQKELLAAVSSLTSGSQAVLRKQQLAPCPSSGSGGGSAHQQLPRPALSFTPLSRTADVLIFNDAYAHKQSKIRIVQLQAKDEAQEESAATSERVFAERQYVVDAAIVRFMKSRRKVLHADLMAELPSMLKFPVAVSDIKKRIETLIDRDFLQRNPQDSTIYEYRA
jgi:cullin-4